MLSGRNHPVVRGLINQSRYDRVFAGVFPDPLAQRYVLFTRGGEAVIAGDTVPKQLAANSIAPVQQVIDGHVVTLFEPAIAITVVQDDPCLR